MKNDFYTYAYLRKDGTPYYVGKGKGNRAFAKGSRRFPPPTKDRILFLKTGLTEEEAFRHEIYMIAVLGRKDIETGILWNFTDGGDGLSGYICPPGVREKHRKNATGRTPTEETRKKLRESKSGVNNPNYGKTTTPEVKAKMSASLTGRTFSESHIQKLKENGNVGNVRHLGTEALKRPVVGVNPDGESFTFSSAKEAEDATGISKANISACCHEKRKSAGKWTWTFFE